MIYEITSITDTTTGLKSLSPSDGDWALVLNYYPGILGGGGEFYFDGNSFESENGGTIFIPDSTPPEKAGRWIRQYEGKLNVAFFGVVHYPSSLPDNAARINNAITYAASLAQPPIGPNSEGRNLTVFFPDGIYPIHEKINLKPYVSLKGDSCAELTCDDNFIDEFIFDAADPGPMLNMHVENFILSCHGDEKRLIGGLRLQAIPNQEDEGGAWYCTFKNLKILDATLDGIALLGGEHIGPSPYAFRLTHQYLVFENIDVQRKNINCNSLKIRGTVINSSFLRCDFEIPFDTTGEMGIDGINVFIGTISTIGEVPSSLKFTQCSTGGHVRYGFMIQKSQNITFDTCWIEQTDIAFDISDSQSIDIINCRFANAATQGTAKKNNGEELINSFILDEDPNAVGRCINSLNSSVNIKDNYVTVTDDGTYKESPIHAEVMDRLAHSRFILSVDENALNVEDNFFQNIRLNATFGITQYDFIKLVSNYYNSSPSDVPGIEIGGRKIILLTENVNGLKVIHRINSTINAGEFLTIRAEGQEIQILEWDPVNETLGKNIYHSGKGTLTLPHGAIAHYLKLDGINKQEWCSYQLISTTGFFV